MEDSPNDEDQFLPGQQVLNSGKSGDTMQANCCRSFGLERGYLKGSLITAIHANHVSLVHHLIAMGAPVDFFHIGASPLGIAIRKDSLAMVQLLVREGQANTNKVGKKTQCSALMLAVRQEVQEECIQAKSIVRFLLSQGVSVTLENENRDTALHLAAMEKGVSPQLLKLLLNKGRIHLSTFASSEGVTPLHKACEHGLLDNARLLVELGSNVMAKDKDGTTSLHSACSFKGNAFQLTQYLLQHGADANALSTRNGTPLHCGVEANVSNATIDLLLDYGANVDQLDCHGFTPLFMAHQLGRMQMFRHLIRRNANVNAQNGFEKTTVLHKACFDGDGNLVEQLLEEFKADIMCLNRYRWTVLHFLVHSGSETYRAALNVVSNHLLASVDMDKRKKLIDTQDRLCRTPLFVAAHLGMAEKVEILLNLGACPNLPGNRKEDDHPECFPCDLVSPCYAAFAHRRYEICKTLIRRGARVDDGQSHRTFLHEACELGHVDMIQFLLDNGASLHRRSWDGSTALHYAAAGGHCDGTRVLLNQICPRPPNGCSDSSLPKSNPHACLLEQPNRSGSTPLHRACHCGRFGTAQLLLDHGACSVSMDFLGVLPVEKAALSKSSSAVYLVLNAMAGSDWFGRSQKCERAEAKLHVRRQRLQAHLMRKRRKRRPQLPQKRPRTDTASPKDLMSL